MRGNSPRIGRTEREVRRQATRGGSYGCAGLSRARADPLTGSTSQYRKRFALRDPGGNRRAHQRDEREPRRHFPHSKVETDPRTSRPHRQQRDMRTVHALFSGARSDTTRKSSVSVAMTT